MSETRSDDPLTTLLRAADPAAGEPGLSPVEQAAMRRRVLAAGRERRRRKAGWLVPATAAMAILALALGLALRQPRPAPPTSIAETAPRAARSASSGGQQIQFTTDSGILVVWVLQPRSTG